MADDDSKPNVLSRLSGAVAGITTGLVGGGIVGFVFGAGATTLGGVMVGGMLGGSIGFIVGSAIGAAGGLLFGLGEALIKFDTSNILPRINKGVEIGGFAVAAIGGILGGTAGGALGAVIGLPVGVIGALDAGIRRSLSRAELGFTQGLMASLTFTGGKNETTEKMEKTKPSADISTPVIEITNNPGILLAKAGPSKAETQPVTSNQDSSISKPLFQSVPSASSANRPLPATSVTPIPSPPSLNSSKPKSSHK